MMKMHILLFIFLYYITSNCTDSAAAIVNNNNNRRTLHQPFFPQDSPGVPPPPPSSAAADVPFTPNPTGTPSSPPNDQPFFQTIPSPPPPLSVTTNPSASFPANISSLNLPSSSKSKPVSAKLIATAVTLVVAAAVVVSVVVYLRVQKRRLHDSRSVGDEKTYRSDSSSSRRVTIACNVNHNNNNNGGGAAGGGGAGARNDNNNLNRIPKLNRPSQSSAEFLYLGTLVSSQGGIDVTNNNTNAISRENNRVRGVGGGGGGVGDLNLNFRKLDSPELRPLPPLVSVGGGGRSQSSLRNPNLENVEVDSSRDEEFEEFYSPRGSIGTGSGSRSAFSAAVPAAAADGYESRRMIGSGSSSSCSSSSSGSPVRSVSLSISPPVSLSPIRSRPKSPELVALQNVPPPSRAAPPPPPPPPPPLNIRLNKDSLESSPRSSDSNSSSSGQGSPPPPAGIPPPPPPPPPAPKHWESSSPKTPTPPLQPLLKPPVLITPTRPLPLPLTNNDQPPISPMELLPENPENHETPKPKLKPLHWDKVRASSGREMVWDQLKSSSFKLNEEMIETLFTVKTPNSANSNETSATRRPILSSPTGHENRVLDPKKSQNIAILLRALNVTIEEVCDALLEGNADTLGTELLESLLKMAPTKEEERKLIEFKDDSPIKLGPAEKFLKAVLDVPFAFKRVDAMLYISNFDSEIEYLKRSFQTLEVACEELRNSRMFLKLLEAVLKTGNRMNVGTNRGDAHAFKLDTLLKLVDVKGTDGKTTLLHFVVQEITKSEGARLSTATAESNHPETPKGPADETKCRKLGLQVVAGISSELSNVKKSAAMDSEVLDGDVVKLSKGIANITEVVRLIETTRSDGGGDQTRFSRSMNEFIKTAEEEIIRIQAQESVALSLVKEITEYFHGNSAKEEAHPFRIFLVVRDFLTVLDRVCKEVGSINERIVISSAHKFPVPINPTLPPVFSGFPGRQAYSSSDDESSGSSFRVSS